MVILVSHVDVTFPSHICCNTVAVLDGQTPVAGVAS